MKRVIVLLAALLLVLATAVPASAAKPIPVFDRDYDNLSDPFYDLCPFGVIYHGYGHESYVEWRDATGFPIKGRYQNQGTDSYVNELTGVTVAGDFRFTSHSYDFALDPATGIASWLERVTGSWWSIQLPAAGTVFHESGQARQSIVAPSEDPATWVYTVSRFTGNSTFDVEELCEALAP